VQILCPFCEQPHPIHPNKAAACGTVLRVSAVQTVYPARTTKKAEVVCVKCGKAGGEMVAYGKGFIHTIDCNPERRLLSSPPIYSEWARRVYNMPMWLRVIIQKISGPIIEVNEVDETGKETGKVLGYYFGVPIGNNKQREHPKVGA